MSLVLCISFDVEEDPLGNQASLALKRETRGGKREIKKARLALFGGSCIPLLFEN